MKSLFLVILLTACGTESQLTDRGFENIEGDIQCADGGCGVTVTAPETCLAVVQLITKNSAFVWRRLEMTEGEVMVLPAQVATVEENFTLTADPTSLTYRCY